jgi:gas vesicle protein
MGYIRGVVHGTVAGTILGICIAPQQGKRTREQLSAFGNAARDGYGLAEKTVRQVAPLAGAAVHIIKSQISGGPSKKQKDEEDLGVDDNIRIHHETNNHN